KKRLAAACIAATLSGLVQAGEPAAENERELALALHESAMRAALAKPGATVCRQFQVGIAERDWIRGEVVEVQGHLVAVRIAHPGRFPHILNGISVVPGTVLWAVPAAWTPCV